jgi:hypothetical protein
VATLDIFHGDVEVVVFHHVVLTDTHKVKSLPIKRHVMWITSSRTSGLTFVLRTLPSSTSHTWDHNHQLFYDNQEIHKLPFHGEGIKIYMVSSLFMKVGRFTLL